MLNRYMYHPFLVDFALLFFRLAIGGMMLFAHGWPKLATYSERVEAGRFSDPFGVGVATSLALAIFAEVFCAALLMAGFFTRFSSIPLMITMFVAGVVHHYDDPFAQKEKALLFLVCFILIFFTGPGRYSIDYMLFRNKSTLS